MDNNDVMTKAIVEALGIDLTDALTWMVHVKGSDGPIRVDVVRPVRWFARWLLGDTYTTTHTVRPTGPIVLRTAPRAA